MEKKEKGPRAHERGDEGISGNTRAAGGEKSP